MLKFYVATTQMLRTYVVHDQRGVTAIEYGLIAGLVAALLIFVLSTTGTSLNDILNGIANAVGDAADTVR